MGCPENILAVFDVLAGLLPNLCQSIDAPENRKHNKNIEKKQNKESFSMLAKDSERSEKRTRRSGIFECYTARRSRKYLMLTTNWVARYEKKHLE